MYKKYFLLSLCLVLFQLGYSQSTGALTGTIVNTVGNPISDVNLELEGTSLGTESNFRGEFQLSNIPVGNYILKVSYVGYQSLERSIVITENKVNDLKSIVLKTRQESLDEVVVKANGNPNTFTRAASEHVAKLPLSNIENPQVYNTITAELLEQQVVTNFDDAIKNAPGLTKLWESTGRGGDGAGYFSLRGFPVQPTLVNGLPGITNSSPDPANIERIEVVKGPSGTLYGSSLISYGGLINITTKKPYNYFGGTLSYTAGSYGLNRITADVNTPLDEQGNIALRVNTAYHTENSYQDAGFKKSFFFAPSLSYTVNDRLSFLINTEIYSGKSTNPTMLFVDRGAPLRVHNIDELGYDNKRSYTSNDQVLENPTFNLQGQMNYKLSDSWNSQTVLSRGVAKTKGYYSYLYETTRFYQGRDEVEGELTNLDEGVVFSRYTSDQNSTTLTTDLQQNFTGDFKIAGLRNRMVVGVDYFHRKTIDNSSAYVGNGNIYIGNASLQNVNESVYNIFNPEQYVTNGDNGILSAAAVDNLIANSPRNNNETKEEVYSAYVSNVIDFTSKLSAMASLRVDQFESANNSQTALSPKFGLVYQPVEGKVALFANYMDGFTNVSPSQEGDPAQGNTTTRTFDPEHANQIEFGTKLNLLDNKLSASLSYYDIQVSNIVMEETGRPFYYVQDGERYSRGFEASITASPLRGLNFIAGYSYNDSKLTKSDQTDFLNRRPESAGPKNLANLWASYQFHEGHLNGFGLGFGGNYADVNKIFNREVGGVFELPSYTILNAAVFYNSDKFGINLKLNNLTNKEYYSGWSTINPQTPRNVAANLSYKF
ncbi:TonB-dependent receptor [Gillisia sp. M10.2A]|uniref:TonB-dependent receptor n=1 Tax=Gillisia lutea TaxID=2909668 RepID=A0ABS9EGL8_9FLAO|nr:TonB-dependent receptor [Gillisia lutea]MCF4101289.1 TonB-dependent receptor [Gillisia lutea]